MNEYFSKNFTWIDSFISGAPAPQSVEDIKFLNNEGITDIICLLPTIPFIEINNPMVKVHQIPISQLPNRNQLKEFLELVENLKNNHKKVLIHCQFGQERTGIFLAVYLIKFYNLKPKEAVSKIRKLRPTTLKSSISTEFVLSITDKSFS